MKALDAKRWSVAFVSLVALVLAGSYSVTAALGNASGGRINTAASETAATDARAKVQATYASAKAELDGLKPSRPSGELEALVAARTGRNCRVQVTLGSRTTVCPTPPALAAELGRAKRRGELEGKMEKAAAELAKTQPAKVANSDAKALARYLGALGLDLTPERLNDLLVLLAVLMVETGGGLSLAIGVAFTSTTRTPSGPVNAASVQFEQSRTPWTGAVQTPSYAASVRTEHRHPTTVVRPSDVMAWLRSHGGRAETSMRRLANALGRSPSGVHDELRRLVASGLVTAASGPRGTVLALMAGANSTSR
jgi:hypothetical protein